MTHGVVIQPHAIVFARVLVQWVRTVCGRLAVEANVDGLARYHCRVVWDALVDVDTGVVTLSPCCVLEVSLVYSVGLRGDVRWYLLNAAALVARREVVTAVVIFML